jgi:predicted ATPase
MAEGIIARQSELAALDDFLASADEWPGALYFEGAAGIGKTRLWREGVERARSRGMRVLATRPGSAEVRLAFAGIADLLREVLDEVLDQLPAP